MTTAPTIPVAVAKMAQVTMVATASDAGNARGGEVQAAEQLVDELRALDQVAHEQEQRDRDQHVVRHHAVGPLDEEVQDRATAVDGSMLR